MPLRLTLREKFQTGIIRKVLQSVDGSKDAYGRELGRWVVDLDQ